MLTASELAIKKKEVATRDNDKINISRINHNYKEGDKVEIKANDLDKPEPRRLTTFTVTKTRQEKNYVLVKTVYGDFSIHIKRIKPFEGGAYNTGTFLRGLIQYFHFNLSNMTTLIRLRCYIKKGSFQ
jgi:ribosomal protein L21E